MRKILRKLCTDHTQQILELLENSEFKFTESMQKTMLGKVNSSYENDFLRLIAKGHFNIIDSIFIKLALRKYYLDATRNAFYISRVFEST